MPSNHAIYLFGKPKHFRIQQLSLAATDSLMSSMPETVYKRIHAYYTSDRSYEWQFVVGKETPHTIFYDFIYNKQVIGFDHRPASIFGISIILENAYAPPAAMLQSVLDDFQRMLTKGDLIFKTRYEQQEAIKFKYELLEAIGEQQLSAYAKSILKGKESILKLHSDKLEHIPIKQSTDAIDWHVDKAIIINQTFNQTGFLCINGPNINNMSEEIKTIERIEKRIQLLEQEVQDLKQTLQRLQAASNKPLNAKKDHRKQKRSSEQRSKQTNSSTYKGLKKVDNRYWMLDSWELIEQLKISGKTKTYADNKDFATYFSNYAYQNYKQKITSIIDPKNSLSEQQIKRRLRKAILQNEGVYNTQLSIPISWAKRPPKDRPYGEGRVCIYDEQRKASFLQSSWFTILLFAITALLIVALAYYLTLGNA